MDIDSMNHSELMTYARDNLGMNFSPGMSAEKMRAKIRDIEITKGTRDAPPAGGKGAARSRKIPSEVVPMKDLPLDQTSVIVIDEGSGKHGGYPVDVVVNGRNFQIKRGVKVRVPNYVVGVLEDAITTITDQVQDPVTGNYRNVTRDTPSYPFRIVDGPAENDPKPDEASAA